MKISTNNKFFIVCFCFFVLTEMCQKQQSQAQNPQDCIGAIPICQNVYFEQNAYAGVGDITNEINPIKSCLESGEKNNVWYVFTVQESGLLSFSITPNDMDDDYDWAVFNLTNNPCSDIKVIGELEVSCNFDAQEGITGPNGAAGPQNEQPIEVTKGETYVISVNQYSLSDDGYKIDFTESTAIIFDQNLPHLVEVETPILCGASSIKFTMSENILCSSIDTSDFIISGPGGPYTISDIQAFGCDNSNYDRFFEATINPPIQVGGQFQMIANGQIVDLCSNTDLAYKDTLNFVAISLTGTVNNTLICEGDGKNPTITIQNGTGIYNFYENTVSPQSLLATGTSYDPSPTIKTDTTYTFLITQMLNDCESSPDTITYAIGLAQTPEFTALPAQVPTGTTTTVTFTGIADPNATFAWNFDGAEIVSGENQGPYTVKWETSGNKKIWLHLTSPVGCTYTAYTMVEVSEVMFVPNDFNAHNNLNDIFKINSVPNNITASYMILFNQLGQKVYQTNSLHIQGWDAIFKNQLIPAAPYYYFINTTNNKGKQENYKGSFILIK